MSEHTVFSFLFVVCMRRRRRLEHDGARKESFFNTTVPQTKNAKH